MKQFLDFGKCFEQYIFCRTLLLAAVFLSLMALAQLTLLVVTADIAVYTTTAGIIHTQTDVNDL